MLIPASVDEATTVWNSYAFQQRSSFPPCTSQYCKDRNIAHTHTMKRFYELQPPKGKGSPIEGRNSLFLFVKDGKSKGKGMSNGKGKGMSNGNGKG